MQMTEFGDEKLVGLQLSHDGEKDALRVSFVIGGDLDVVPIVPGAHVLTTLSACTSVSVHSSCSPPSRAATASRLESLIKRFGCHSSQVFRPRYFPDHTRY